MRDSEGFMDTAQRRADPDGAQLNALLAIAEATREQTEAIETQNDILRGIAGSM